MYRDKSLTPAETVRLAALGLLMEGDRSYSTLASDVRSFIARMAGPSLDLLGSSLELLRVEGLVIAKDRGEDPLLSIAPEGEERFHGLMRCKIKTPVNDAGRLALALKLRFFNLMSREDKVEQVDLLLDLSEAEMSRLESLRDDLPEGPLSKWLGVEIESLRQRLEWLEGLAADLQ